MADGFDGGGAMAAPPVGGLGNFKGVMLCNRPSDEPMSKLGSGGDGPAPFKSMISATHNEQLGLPPCKSGEESSTQGVKKRGPSAALRQHVRWLRELQDQMRGEREMVDEDEKTSEERKQRMKAAADRHREGVRKMMEERDRGLQPPPAAKAKEGGAAKKAAKPLWAMTSKEKDDFEDEEADGLINFAENLDFDKFVGDLEFKHGLEALKDRAGKLQKESNAFKDALVADFNAADEEGQSTSAGGSPRSLRLEDGIDGQSVLGDLKSEYSTYSRKSAGEDRYGKPDWDGSTSCGDGPQIDREVKDAAMAVLESNSQIRAVHSKGSVAKLIEKTQAKLGPTTPADLIESMRRDGPAQVPVITSSEDTQQRLHKPADPSQLPYLYRSPAV